MVNSMGLKGGFIVIVIIAFIITLVSIFTPAWKVTNNQGSDQKYGLVTTDCGNQQGQIMQQNCQQASDNRQGYEKWTLALIILSAIFQIIAIIAAMATIKSETKAFMIAPLMAIIAIILLIIAIIVYGSKLNDTQNNLNNQFYQPGQPAPPPPQNYQYYSMNGNYSLGYSFWLAIVAGIFLAVAAILGFIAAFMGSGSGSGFGGGGYHRDTTVVRNHHTRTSLAA